MSSLSPSTRTILLEKKAKLLVSNEMDCGIAVIVSENKKSEINQIEIDVSPNPFNPVAFIEINGLTHENRGENKEKLLIFNVNGKIVADLSSSPYLSPSTPYLQPKRLSWDASGLPSGTYIIRLISGKSTYYKHAVLLK